MSRRATAVLGLAAVAGGALAPHLLARPVAGAALSAIVLFGAVSIIALSRFLKRRGIDPLDPAVAFPLATVAWFAVASLPLLSDREGHRPPLSPRAWLLVVPALAAFGLGVRVAPRPPSSRRLPAHAAARFEPRRLLAVLATLFALAAAALGAVWTRSGVPFLSGSLEEMRLTAISSGWTRAVALLLVPVATLVLAHAATLGRGEKLRAPFILLLAASLVLLAATGGRGFVIIPIGTGIVLFHVLRRPLSLGRFAALCLLLALFSSAYLAVRGMSHYGTNTYVEYLSTITHLPDPLAPLAPVVLGLRASPVAFGELLDVVPREVPFQLGRFLVAPLVSFLPGHQAWAPEFIQGALRHEFPGFGEPATIFGSFYLDFGVPGVLAGSFLTGLAWSALRRRFEAMRDLLHAILLAQAAVLVLLSIYGDVYGGLVFFLFVSGICFVVIALAGARPASAPPEVS